MNKMLLKSTLVSAALLLGLSPASLAGTGDVALGIKAGTTGLGGEVTIGILPHLNARTGYNAFSYDGSATKDDNEYSYNLKLGNLPLLVDWYPLPGGFRISGGLMINNNKIDATAKPSGSYKIGDTTYPAAAIGNLTGKIDFNSSAPYLGIGFGNAVGRGIPLSLSLDLGVMFQGTPKVSLAASGPIASDPTFQANLAKEENNIKDTTDNIKYYPVIALGMAYRF